MSDPILKRFESPDEVRNFEKGRFELVSLGPLTIGRATYEPGWRWSVHVGPTEYRLLHFFMTHADRVYTRTQLLDHVWGGNNYVEERTVDVHIRRLRKALEPGNLQEMVQTVRGSGYRFSASA